MNTDRQAFPLPEMPSSVVHAFAVVDAYTRDRRGPCQSSAYSPHVHWPDGCATVDTNSSDVPQVAAGAGPAKKQQQHQQYYRMYCRSVAIPSDDGKHFEDAVAAAAALSNPLAHVLPAFRVHVPDTPCPFHTHRGTARRAIDDLWRAAADLMRAEQSDGRDHARHGTFACQTAYVPCQSRMGKSNESGGSCVGVAHASAETRNLLDAVLRQSTMPHCGSTQSSNHDNYPHNTDNDTKMQNVCMDNVCTLGNTLPFSQTALPPVPTLRSPQVTQRVECVARLESNSTSAVTRMMVADASTGQKMGCAYRGDASRQEVWHSRPLRRQRNQLHRVYREQYRSGALGVLDVDEEHTDKIIRSADSGDVAAETAERSYETRFADDTASAGASRFGETEADARSRRHFRALSRRRGQPMRVHARGAGEPPAHLRGSYLIAAEPDTCSSAAGCCVPLHRYRLAHHPTDSLLGAVYRDE